MIRTAKYFVLTALAAVLTLGLSNTGALAQVVGDGYDQQQWWNPGDWFDDQQQYNLFSDDYYDYSNTGYGDGYYDNDWFDNDEYWGDAWDYDYDEGFDYGYDEDFGYDYED